MSFSWDINTISHDQQDLISNADSGYNSVFDTEVPQPPPPLPAVSSSVQNSISSLRERFTCTHPSAAKARRRYEQVTISRYTIRLRIDPIELLQFCSGLGNQLLSDLESVKPAFHNVCCQILQQILGYDNAPLADWVRLSLRLLYLPGAFQECHLPKIASALELSREDIVNDDHGYGGFFAISGRISGVSLAEYEIYSQTFKCNNPRCNNKNKLHYTPSTSQYRVVKSTEGDGFMETATSSTLLRIDLICSHCALSMPESVMDRVYISTSLIPYQEL
ncbi:hypothetical protein BGZ80_011380 [Entomortierella chlamydospora]|uniref:MCMDC2 N-terminal domain-containing protein n=1 Tax=Entomortierella chlamydospora TaxID=101097 RepID=A0A9P6SZN4_9FUNG|nr:hypothetical protein BGZ80_011380 [Entomortierella chlamydospora]